MNKKDLGLKNQIIGIGSGIILLLLALGMWLSIRPKSDTNLMAFNALLVNSQQKVLDLSHFDVFEWDEVSYWAPYADICDLNIDGYVKGGPLCESSEDDGESYLVFLKGNKLAYKIRINRRQIDFAASQIPWRVKKEKAIFDFEVGGDWPTVRLHSAPAGVKDIPAEKNPNAETGDEVLDE